MTNKYPTMGFCRRMYELLKLWQYLRMILFIGALSGLFLWISIETGDHEMLQVQQTKDNIGLLIARLYENHHRELADGSQTDLDFKPKNTRLFQTFINNKKRLTGASANAPLWHDLDILNQPRFGLDPSFKSPCWWTSSIPEVTCEWKRSRTKRTLSRRKHEKGYLRCLPYFYLIGQAKCATGDLFKKITKHPEVAPMGMKETQWVCRSRLYENCSNIDTYLTLLQKSANFIQKSYEDDHTNVKYITGEGTPGYFSNNDFWDMLPGNEGCTEPCVTNANNIHHLVPNAKLILIMRNPTTRLYSLYFHKARLFEAKTSQEHFHDLVVREVDKFQRCLEHQTLRGCCYNYTISDSLTGEIDIRRGIYHIFLADWMKVFPVQQFHIIKFEEYISNQTKTLKQIYKFLDLSELLDEKVKKITSIKNNKQHSSRVEMWNTTRSILDSFYKPYNEHLVELLSDDRFRW